MSYSIRQSQAIHTWPAGSIIDFPHISLIMLCHDDHSEDWGHDDGDQEEGPIRNIIRDPRLEEAFHVERFVAPPVQDGVGNLRIQAIRFPRAQRCPKCGLITVTNKSDGEREDPASNTGASYNQRMTAIHCPDCINIQNIKASPRLIPMRFVIATEEGFLDDFPWDWYVHIDLPDERGKKHKLYWKRNGGSASLYDIYIISKNRGSGKEIKRRSLGKIFDQKIFTDICPVHGHYLKYVENKMPKPWKNWQNNCQYEIELVDDVPIYTTQEGELTPLEKRKFPRTIQRGAGNLFFPVVYSGIKLPEQTYTLQCPENIKNIILNIQKTIPDVLPESKKFGNNEWRNFLLKQIDTNSTHSLLTLGYDIDEVRRYVKNFLGEPAREEYAKKEYKLRSEEFNAFCIEDLSLPEDVWFKKSEYQGEPINKTIGIDGFIDKVVLLEKLSMLKVYRGFTRIKPLSNEELLFSESKGNLDSKLKIEFERLQDCRKYPFTTHELPAVEIKGEGIFIKFKDDILNQWAMKYPDDRIKGINENIVEMNKVFHSSARPINKRYLLLHTLSHVIMKELSEDCGYSLSSIAEVVYCSDERVSDNTMNGILIYTTTTDNEGSMGGLVNKGKPEFLAKVIRSGVDKSRWCSSDPLCMSAESGQGFMGLNLAACYSCLLLPETSCENMNKYLDRATIVGTLDNPIMGCFN